MEKELISASGVNASFCYSPAIRYGNLLFVSGQVGTDESGGTPEGIEVQTSLAIQNAEKLIKAAGGALCNVLMCQCFLQSENCFEGMNRAYAGFFGGDHNLAPARCTVIAPALDKKFLVEITMIVGL